MKFFFTLALIGLFTTLSAQEVTYPYNPDANNDQYVAVSDELSTISAFGSDFLPEELEVNGVGLAEVLAQLIDNQNMLQSTVEAQQAYISDLQQYISIDLDLETVLISGANLQVVNGVGYTDAWSPGDINGKGNIIIGYDESGDGGVTNKSGSHNLVVGKGHTYTSFGGIVVGRNNSITGTYSIAFGEYNTASGGATSVLGGAENTALGYGSSVAGGTQNNAHGVYHTSVGDHMSTYLDFYSTEYLLNYP